MASELISIIMPVYNGVKYLHEAIQSVLGQSYTHWELLIVDDGSTDDSRKVIQTLMDSDARIRLISQEHKGISAARNAGLDRAGGDVVCFLDSDDVLPPDSMESRLNILKKTPGVDFVDGVVQILDESMSQCLRAYQPSFRGHPLRELFRQSRSCFFGPSWMIRISRIGKIRFNEKLTHAEDLFFYMQCSRTGGLYDFTSDPILRYRFHSASVMNQLEHWYESHQQLERELLTWPERSTLDRMISGYKTRKAYLMARIKRMLQMDERDQVNEAARFSSPSELRKYVLDTADAWETGGCSMEATALREAATIGASSGWEWLGLLVEAATQIRKSKRGTPDLHARLDQIIRTAKSRNPYG